MADAKPYLYEFLWRGRAAAGGEGGAYHVILAQDIEDAFGHVQTSFSHAMTPEQAEANGFDLPKVVAEINGDTLRRLTSTETELGASKDREAAMRSDLEAASRQLADRQSRLDTTEGASEVLQKRLDAALAR